MINLSQGKIGYKYIIKNINKDSLLKTRLQDMGFVKNTEVICLYKSFAGDPVAYKVKGSVVALRKKDANDIIVKIPGDYI